MRIIYFFIVSFFFLFLQTIPIVDQRKPQTELPIIILITSYNNADYFQWNLDSVLNQTYSNYQVIIVDDASEDKTGNLIENYLKNHELQHKVTLIKNIKRCRKLHNLYTIIHQCPDQALIVQIDGDDWWEHNHVLADINKAYQKHDIWLTYGQYRNVPKEEAEKWGYGEIGYSAPVSNEIIKSRSFRTTKWIYMQQRSFCAWLFKLIKLEDFLTYNIPGFEGKFYPAANDCAMMYPMLEMAHYRFKFLPDICYIRNLYSPIVGFKIDKEIQHASGREIRKKPKYTIVDKPIINRMSQFEHAQADIIVYSENNPEGLSQVLTSMYQYVTDIHKITIIYRTTKEQSGAYQKIKKCFSSDAYSKISTIFVHDKNINAIEYIKNASDHIIFVDDQCTIINQIEANKAIKKLEQTGAYGFYFALNPQTKPFYISKHSKQKGVPYQHLEDNVYAWKFWSSYHSWSLFNSFSMTLYRKSDILYLFEALPPISMKEFQKAWYVAHVNLNKVGLFLDISCIVVRNEL